MWYVPRAIVVGVLLAACGFFITMNAGRAADISIGSGVVIGTPGEVLTNDHVVENCAQITVRSSSGDSTVASLVARDEKNDLAVIRSQLPFSAIATFREGPIRAGDVVVALGYPLSGLLATTANLTVGNVSALAGLGDDSRYLQISAPVQPGNSGGPLLDASGHIVGIVTAKLDAALVARFTGDIPQNVNFALKAEVARTFLDSKGISYQSAHSEVQLSPADVGDIARPFTVQIACYANPQLSQHVPGGAPSTQQAVLYEEDLNDPQGRRYIGSAIWRTEMVSPGSGLAPALAVRADVEIPDRHLAMTWSLHRNTDRALPASHMIGIMFNLPADFPGGGIANVPGILMKDSEKARGSPLAGLAVKITDGSFLIGLSAVDNDLQHNMDLLKNRQWFDIPIVYADGGRAILAVEKGQPGDRAFTEAFAAWKESPVQPSPSPPEAQAAPAGSPQPTTSPPLPKNSEGNDFVWLVATQDVHLRQEPRPDAPYVLEPPNEFIPKGTLVAARASSKCSIWTASGRGEQDADNIWCPVIYGAYSGWANGLYLQIWHAKDQRPVACILHPAARGCGAVMEPEPPPQTSSRSQGSQTHQTMLRVERNLLMHTEPRADSPNVLGPPPHDYIPSGAVVVAELDGDSDDPKCRTWTNPNYAWCAVRYGNSRGWVNAWFLLKDDGTRVTCTFFPNERICRR